MKVSGTITRGSVRKAPRREQRIGTALKFRNPAPARSNKGGATRGQARAAQVRAGNQYAKSQVRSAAPSSQKATSVGLSAYQNYANSISRAAKRPMGPGLLNSIPKFESHFNFDPIGGLGDAFRKATSPLIDYAGNSIRDAQKGIRPRKLY